MTSGLPQGSQICPLLFILYYDDVASVLKKVKCSLFADDLKMFHEIKTLSDALDLETDIYTFAAWCMRNYMSINVDKCKIMSFYRITIPTMFTYSIEDIELTRVVESILKLKSIIRWPCYSMLG